MNTLSKICNGCKVQKEVNLFSKDKTHKDGFSSICKSCRLLKSKNWYRKNTDKKKEYDKNYFLLNKKIILQRNKEYYKKYYCENKEKIFDYVYSRRKNNIQFRLKANLRKRLHYNLKNGKKAGSTVHDLGCTIEELKLYLESKFKPGMSWENYGMRGWHVDHIILLSNFDLTNREQFLKACHYTNLQPLWWLENLRKNHKTY